MNRKDLPYARSLVAAARIDMTYLSSLAVTDDSVITVVRGVYENFRMLGKALLVARGTVVIDDHKESIAALLVLDVSLKRPLGSLDSLRILRHAVNYRGFVPSVAQALDALELARDCFDDLATNVEKEIEH